MQKKLVTSEVALTCIGPWVQMEIKPRLNTLANAETPLLGTEMAVW